MNKVVFAPLSNTYSHIADCLAVADLLPRDDYRIRFLTTQDKRGFVAQQGYQVTETLELWQERGEQEVMSWFDDPQWFRQVVEDELQALQQLAPDLVIGSYRYTTRLTCRRLGVPFFSIMGPNMAPSFRQFLGIPPNLVDERSVQVMLRVYRERLEHVMAALPGWETGDLQEVRSLLPGDRTFFHTLPELEPLEGLDPSYCYVGPIRWQGWRDQGPGPSYSTEANCKVLVFLGSVIASHEALGKLVGALDRPGLESVVVAPAPPTPRSPRLRFTPRIDLEAALARCDLAVVHGGLNAIHHCLHLGKPCLVLPYQVEQAQNALRAEQIGIGRNLLGHGLKGELEALGPGDVVKRLKVFLRYQQQIGKTGVEQIAGALEQAVIDAGWRAQCHAIAHEWGPRFQRHMGAKAIAAAIREQLEPAPS